MIKNKNEHNLSGKVLGFLRTALEFAKAPQNYITPEKNDMWDLLRSIHQMPAIDRSNISSTLRYSFSIKS